MCSLGEPDCILTAHLSVDPHWLAGRKGWVTTQNSTKASWASHRPGNPGRSHDTTPSPPSTISHPSGSLGADMGLELTDCSLGHKAQLLGPQGSFQTAWRTSSHQCCFFYGLWGQGMDTWVPLPDVTSDISCLRRDLLPSTLRLPQAILEAHSFTDLETISNLGLGKSSLCLRAGVRASEMGPQDCGPPVHRGALTLQPSRVLTPTPPAARAAEPLEPGDAPGSQSGTFYSYPEGLTHSLAGSGEAGASQGRHRLTQGQGVALGKAEPDSQAHVS